LIDFKSGHSGAMVESSGAQTVAREAIFIGKKT